MKSQALSHSFAKILAVATLAFMFSSAASASVLVGRTNNRRFHARIINPVLRSIEPFDVQRPEVPGVESSVNKYFGAFPKVEYALQTTIGGSLNNL